MNFLETSFQVAWRATSFRRERKNVRSALFVAIHFIQANHFLVGDQADSDAARGEPQLFLEHAGEFEQSAQCDSNRLLSILNRRFAFCERWFRSSFFRFHSCDVLLPSALRGGL